ITLLAIFGFALLVHPISSDSPAGRITNAGAAALFSLCIGLTALLVILERTPQLMSRMIAGLAARMPGGFGARAAPVMHQFVEGLSLFRDLPRLTTVMALSFLTFGAFALCLTVSMWAMHIDVPWFGGLLMLVITAIGIMVPAAPGYIG